MGEESKKGTDIKKMKYEEPRLVKISDYSGNKGEGQVPTCATGSGEDACGDGNAAIQVCGLGQGGDPA